MAEVAVAATEVGAAAVTVAEAAVTAAEVAVRMGAGLPLTGIAKMRRGRSTAGGSVRRALMA